MAAQGRSEFSLALNQVAHERGLDPFEVLDTIKSAILAAYRRDYGAEATEEIEAQIDAESGEVQLVKEGKDITPPGFGRIAAQTAKQVLLQRIREAEKTAILTDYSKKVGTVVSGMIQRKQGPTFIVDIGRAEAVLPPREQMRGEVYYLNQRLKFYISEIQERDKRSEIVVSRTHPGLVDGLFQQEVPEIAAGSVEIKAVAREAGARAKIAVSSNQIGVDPVGSCVGQRGNRIQTVINELSGEKIDVIQYQEDPAKFIAAALQPAKNVSVAIISEGEEKKAVVTVPEDELSLAIGKQGQNVRLAAKLTGYHIEIVGKEQAENPFKMAAETKAADDGSPAVEEASKSETVSASDETATPESEASTAAEVEAPAVVEPEAEPTMEEATETTVAEGSEPDAQPTENTESTIESEAEPETVTEEKAA